MSALIGAPGVLKATIHVTRAATGKVETYELTGTPIEIVPDPCVADERVGDDIPLTWPVPKQET